MSAQPLRPAAAGGGMTAAAEPARMPAQVREPLAGELPAGPRRELAELAAAALGDLPEAEVPPSLRRVRAFAPARRARAAAAQLLAALDADPVLRRHAGLLWSTAHPGPAAQLPGTASEVAVGGAWAEGGAAAGGSGAALAGAAEAVAEGRGQDGPPGGPEPGEDRARELTALLAGAFLLRPDGWPELVGGLRARLAERETDRQARQADAAARVRAEAATLDLQRARAELAEARSRIAALTEEIAGLRRDQRRLRADADRARAAARTAEQEATRAIEEARARSAEAAEASRLAAEQARAADEALDQARRLAREGRALADSRARLLLDTIVDAASGLRRELALPPATVRPADLAAPAAASGPVPGSPARAQAPDDPAVLEELLGLPQSHLIVDGYNVTKTGYASLPLAEQRRRLVDALGVLAVRTASEVTCCFDGAEVDGRGAWRVRGVRVVFSEPGRTADELVIRLVRAEPPGRPVIVVSSDAEVVAGSRAAGARPVPSTALLRLLAGRG